MEKTIRQEMKVAWVLKALMAAYVVTGLLLLLLTLLVYKMEFSEGKVTAGITAIYVQGNGTNILTSFLLCAAGGMAGGMIS